MNLLHPSLHARPLRPTEGPAPQAITRRRLRSLGEPAGFPPPLWGDPDGDGGWNKRGGVEPLLPTTSTPSEPRRP